VTVIVVAGAACAEERAEASDEGVSKYGISVGKIDGGRWISAEIRATGAASRLGLSSIDT
jgi:hypothetical protein